MSPKFQNDSDSVDPEENDEREKRWNTGFKMKMGYIATFT